jgi:hypothetical protein
MVEDEDGNELREIWIPDDESDTSGGDGSSPSGQDVEMTLTYAKNRELQKENEHLEDENHEL